MSSTQKQWIYRLPSIAKYPGRKEYEEQIFSIFFGFFCVTCSNSFSLLQDDSENFVQKIYYFDI